MQLHSCYCGNVVFLCIKGAITFCTLCQVWCMNVDATLSNQTTSHFFWYSGKWHAMFRICLSLESYFIMFMSRQRMLIRYWEQARNLKSFVVPFHFPRVDHVEQNDVIITCIKWPHESNHKPTVNKKMNTCMYCRVEIDILTMTWPILALSPTTRHLVSIWLATELRFICN